MDKGKELSSDIASEDSSFKKGYKNNRLVSYL